MATRSTVGDDTGMQAIERRTEAPRASRWSLVTGLTIGLMLLGLAAVLGYVALATPSSARFLLPGRAGGALLIGNAVGSSLTLIAPALAAIAGVAWMSDVARRAARLRATPDAAGELARALGPECFIAINVRPPDGRPVSELVVGPHGIAVFEPLPNPTIIRVNGGRWELNTGEERWVPMENPVERTARSADRIRHWLSDDDRDFVVRVYSALITQPGAPPITRTPGCAVISRNQIPAYIASLPAQRSFTAERREQVRSLIRAAV